MATMCLPVHKNVCRNVRDMNNRLEVHMMYALHSDITRSDKHGKKIVYQSVTLGYATRSLSAVLMAVQMFVVREISFVQCTNAYIWTAICT